MLIRHWGGEKKVWSVVRVPTEEEEDRMRLHREIGTLKKERTAHRNRISGLLAGVGLRLRIDAVFKTRLEKARTFDGKPLQPDLTSQLLREHERLLFLEDQLKILRENQRTRVKEKKSVVHEKVAQLIELRGVGIKSSWVLIMEFFGWRDFKNRKEIGALSGLVPTPYSSGTMNRELGISKAGNPRIRSLMVELSWLWLRYQPDSKLSLWFWERFGKGGSRSRRIGIVAVARKLLISFWEYLEKGKLMEGAVLKAGVAQ
jgi:transposase